MAINAEQSDKLVNMAGEWWPAFKPSKASGEAWMIYFRDHTYEAVMLAMLEHHQAGDHYGTPNLKSIIDLLQEPMPDSTAIVAKIDEWYRATSYVSRHPNRQEREEFPLAAECWTLVGGYDAMHNAEWAHKSIQKCYKEAVDNVRFRDSQQAVQNGIERVEQGKLGSGQREVN